MSDWIIATTFVLSVIGLKLLVVSGANNRAEWVAASGTAILALAAVAALAVAVDSLGDARATRHGQLVTELAARWDSEAVHRSMRLFTFHGPTGIIELLERLYVIAGPAATDEDVRLFYRLGLWPDLIETVGVLHDEKVLSTDIVYKMWGPQINMAWEVWREPVRRLRELANAPTSYYYFESLAADMLKAAIKAREAPIGSAILTAAGGAASGSPPAGAEAAELGG